MQQNDIPTQFIEKSLEVAISLEERYMTELENLPRWRWLRRRNLALKYYLIVQTIGSLSFSSLDLDEIFETVFKEEHS